MISYEDYANEVKNSRVEVQPIDINLSNNAYLNPGSLTTVMMNVDTIDPNQLCSIIADSYAIILSKDFLRNNKILMAKIFTNSKFVTIFSQAIGGIQQFTTEQKICCNKLIYDYLSLQHKKDKHIEGLLYNLGLTINKEIIPGLLGLGLDQNTVANLAIARYSTDKEILAVKRVNVIIVNGSLEVMTEQMIVNIYQKLFDHLMPLFEGVMFDKWDDELFQDEIEKEEIYGLINLALLDILNEMPSDMIEHILTQYSQLRGMLYIDKPVRFNIHSISYDYERIINMIDYLEQNGVNIPAM